MMIEEKAQPGSGKAGKFAIQLVIGGLFGLFGSLGTEMLITSGVLGPIDGSRGIALVVAMLYTVIGLFVGFGAAWPRTGAHLLNVEDESDLREQRRMLALSAGSMVVMGVLLALLALASPMGIVSRSIVLPVFAVVAAGLAWATVHMLRDMDELMRAVTRECGEAAYYLLLAIGGGWAVLAHLDYAPAMGMLDFVTLNFVVLLLASFIANGRRGLLKPR